MLRSGARQGGGTACNNMATFSAAGGGWQLVSHRQTHCPKKAPKACSRVQIRLVEGGGVTPNFDVYIGHEIGGTTGLKKSIWASPFNKLKETNPAGSLTMYENHIRNTPDLMLKLPSLQGKILGCVCTDWATCHGRVLMKMVNAVVPRLTEKKSRKHETWFFKGVGTCLSTFYPSPVQVGDELFGSVIQAYAWKHLKHLKQDTAAETIRHNSAYKGNNLLTALIRSCNPKSIFSTEQQITTMAELIEYKWDHCPEFAALCTDNWEWDFIEGTNSSFWGAGIDLADLDPSYAPNTLPGRNILGHIIKFVSAKKMDRLDEWDTRCKLLRQHSEVVSGLAPFQTGLLEVDQIMRPC